MVVLFWNIFGCFVGDVSLIVHERSVCVTLTFETT